MEPDCMNHESREPLLGKTEEIRTDRKGSHGADADEFQFKVLKSVTISLHEVSYSVMLRGFSRQPRRILNSVTNVFRPGENWAVMGASGAGKTTLLNILMNMGTGKMEGDFRVNGQPLDNFWREYRRLRCLVPQDDIMLTGLTPREVLHYCARLRISRDIKKEKREALVVGILQKLSLENCADSIIGSLEDRGISGGERKRVSIGMELLTNPSVMLVDEPTSGLDSKMAEDVALILQGLAREGRTMISTIHQPSYRIFTNFDKLFFLGKGGYVVYTGDASMVEAYFSRIGYAVPKYENPMDHYMRVTQDEATLDSCIEAWERHRMEYGVPNLFDKLIDKEGEFVDLENNSAAGTNDDSYYGNTGRKNRVPDYAISKFKQYLILVERSAYDYFRTPDKFLSMLCLKCLVGLLIGLIWLDQAGTTQDTIFPIQGSFFICNASAMLDTFFAVIFTFPLERAVLVREYFNGVYCLPAYYYAQLTVSMTLQCFFSFVMGLPIYLMVGLDLTPVKFFTFVAVLFLLSMTGVALAFVIGCCVRTIQGAQQAILPTIIPLLLFSGYIIPLQSIASYFKWAYYISFFQYSISILEINQFRDMVFTDCPPVRINPVILQEYNLSSLPIGCFHNGTEFLASMSIHEEDLRKDFGILTAIFAVIVVLGYYVIRISVYRR